MSAFVLRFVGDPTKGYRGKVRHVGTGEETRFSCLEELLAFLDQMNALPSRGWDDGTSDLEPPEPGSCRSPRPPARP